MYGDTPQRRNESWYKTTRWTRSWADPGRLRYLQAEKSTYMDELENIMHKCTQRIIAVQRNGMANKVHSVLAEIEVLEESLGSGASNVDVA